VGRVVVPGSQQPGASSTNQQPVAQTRPMPRPDAPLVPGPGYDQSTYPPPRRQPQPVILRPQAEPQYREQRYAEPHYPEPHYTESRYAEPPQQPYRQRPRRPSAAARVLKTVLVTLLLIAVPIIAGLVAFWITTGEPWVPGR
jgi:hypothetical protein